ncbi:low density lipoprotein receptor adapter protein 1-A isoform X2 [Nematostella vectensis]|uniref:low density lipoprotein receptor adapter protein 1-A isoform X2 n=1 Tax=Nematostella vectensis TaxID=45351 RepID=UPI00138FD9E3|nr:low density lipoprotein receptor adapter protein 1-A isoform X2 [Nematostella vectensis]
MDSLKTVADKVKRSPQVIRRKLEEAYEKRSHRHEELREDWLHQPEPLNDGVPFYVKWLGTRRVFDAKGSGCTDDTVREIVEEAKHLKMSHHEARLQKVLLTVYTKKITIADMETKVTKLEAPIYRVSYCTADPYFPKVFAFIVREQSSRKLYCHTVLCSKESMAKAIALTVADAFTVAYESVQNIVQRTQQETSPQHRGNLVATSSTNITNKVTEEVSVQPQDDGSKSSPCCGESKNPFRADDDNDDLSYSTTNPFTQAEVTSSLTETSDGMPAIHVEGCERGIVNEGLDASQRMETLDLTVDEDFDMEFTRLAKARSSTNLFETPVRRTDFQDDVTSLLATEHTAMDFLKSGSAEDLFATHDHMT